MTNIINCDAPTVPEFQHTDSDPQSSNALPVSYEIKDYKIHQLVGHSHNNISYLAQHIHQLKGLGATSFDYVIIKEYFPGDLAERDVNGHVHCSRIDQKGNFESGKQQFLQEACFLMSLNHPGIVQVNSIFSVNGSVYLVMPFEKGETLFDLMGRVPSIDQQGLLDLLFSITESLSVIHQRGYIHRDLKPSNIFIRESGEPVILDFGAAIKLEQGEQNCLPMISQGYTPIEQYSTVSTEQGYWTDIYALAAVLYKGVSGYAPMDAVERGQKILKDLEDPYVPLATVHKGQYSLRFLNAIDHGLCFRAEDRPQNIGAWCAEFEGLVPVWLAGDSVRKDLLAKTAKRSIDFNLGKL